MTTPGIDDFDLSGLQRQPRPPGRWPDAARLAVAGGAGCGLVVLLEFLAIWGGVQAIFSATVPEGAELRLRAPDRAVQGQAAAMSLVVRNTGDQSFTVRGLTLRGATRRRLTLSALHPAPVTSKISLLGTDTWTYHETIAPGKSWTLQFQATPQEPGKLRGSLEVQVDRGVRRVPVSLEVAPAPTGSAGKKAQPK